MITSLQVVEYSSPYGGSGEDGAFSPVSRAFFALRPFGRRVPGGGDAGSLLPGVLPPELGASLWRISTETCVTNGAWTTTISPSMTRTSTTTTISRRLSKLVAHRPVVTRGTNPSGWPRCDGCTRRCCRRHIQCPPAKGATPALVVATRAAERRSCPHNSPSPQRWSWSGDAE